MIEVFKTRKRKSPNRQPKGGGAQYVYTSLRDKILHLELNPGARLDELGLVKSLNISRTPVREALIRLASEDLVQLLPNRGARVAPLDFMEVAQYFEALELNQRAVNHWAALRRDEEDLESIGRSRDIYDAAVRNDDPTAMIESNRDFHAAIASAARNVHVKAAALQLFDKGMRLDWIWHQQISESDLYEQIHRSQEEHDELVVAIEAKDAGRAEHIGHFHAQTFRQRLTAYLDNNLAEAVEIP